MRGRLGQRVTEANGVGFRSKNYKYRSKGCGVRGFRGKGDVAAGTSEALGEDVHHGLCHYGLQHSILVRLLGGIKFVPRGR